MITREDICVKAIAALNEVYNFKLQFADLTTYGFNNIIIRMLDGNGPAIEVAVTGDIFSTTLLPTEDKNLSFEDILILRIGKAIFENYRAFHNTKTASIPASPVLDTSSYTVATTIKADDVELYNGQNLSDIIVELNTKLADKDSRIQQLEDKISQLENDIQILLTDYVTRQAEPVNLKDYF